MVEGGVCGCKAALFEVSLDTPGGSHVTPARFFFCAHPRFGVEWGLYRSRGFVKSLAGSYHTALLYPVLPLGAKEWPDVGSPKHTSSHAALALKLAP
jgi:hypothetical protein